MSYSIRKIVCLAVFALAVGLFPVSVFAMNGDGSLANPYQIVNYTDLRAFADKVNIDGQTAACAILLRDIDATGQTDWAPIGDNNNKYSGTFDGNGKVINGLTYTNSSRNYAGLFGYVAQGTVKNVGIENGSINAGYYPGAIIGYAINGNIENCYNTGSVTGYDTVGGLIGFMGGGTLSYCYNKGNVCASHSYCGGLVGVVNGGTISDCYNEGDTSAPGGSCGGLVGMTLVSEIKNNYNTGAVTGVNYCGGLVGEINDSQMKNNYNTGEVTGTITCGGLIGKTYDATVSNCYNIGNVSGSAAVAGLIGENGTSSVVQFLYYDADLVYVSEAVCDNQGIFDNVSGLHTSEMTGFDTTVYDNWEDFDTYWVLTESYPVLKNNHLHSITSVSASEATCTTDGNIAYWKCSVCGECYSDANGTTEVSRASVIVPATGHSYGAWTRLDDTKHKRVCANDASHVETENHTWNSGVVTKQATTDATGVKTYTCSVCHATKTESIPKLQKQNDTETKTEAETETETNTNPNTKVVSVKDEPIVSSVSTKGKKSLTFDWTKVDGAEGYDIFFTTCNHDGKKCVCKNVKTIKANKTLVWTKSGLKKGTSYKVCFKAYVIKNGKKKYIKTSPLLHAYTNGGNDTYTNAKSVTVSKKNVTLKKSKTFTIKAKVNKLDKKKKLMPASHVAKLRYYSSDKSIATVNSKGKVKAKGKGICYIDVLAHNGVSAQVKVTVK